MVDAKKSTRVQRIKYAPPPMELPMIGKIDPQECSFFGKTNYVAALEEKKFVFGIKRKDRDRHVYMIGKPSMGKSKALELLIRQDIALGHGVCIFDTDGQLAQNILANIPQERLDDVCYIGTHEQDYVVGFNPLESFTPDTQHIFIEEYVALMKSEFQNDWNAPLEQLIRYLILALYEYPEARGIDIITMVVDPAFREKVLGHITDPMVIRFWQNDFNTWLEKFDMSVIIPFLNKCNQIFAHQYTQKMFSQQHTSVPLESLVMENKIIIISIAKQHLGASGAHMIGSLLMTELRRIGHLRAQATERGTQLQPLYLYIDDAHNIMTDTFETFLHDAHKYYFFITLAHHYTREIDAKLFHTILGSVGTLIAFRTSADDAHVLAHEFEPVFDTKDLTKLGTREFYIRMTIDGELFEPFSAETLDVFPLPQSSSSALVMKKSRDKYTCSEDIL